MSAQDAVKKLAVLGDYEKVFPTSPYANPCRELGFEITFSHDPVTEAEAVELMREADVVVLVRERVPLPDHVLKQLPRLKAISQAGTGVSHIDLDAVNQRGIQVFTSPGLSISSVAELTIGMMIACSRQFPVHQAHLKEGNWIQTPGFELKGKRLGLLGFGKIAKEVAKIASALGMEVTAWRPTGIKGDENSYGVQVLELDELLGTSDVVSVHLRLVPALKGLLNRERLRQLKQGSIVINTSRGALVNTEALVGLLKSGHLRGAGIDTFEEEPLKSNPFADCPNVVLTPHIGYVTWDVLQRFADESLKNIITFKDNSI
ncbi:2-hydroxyacid dehydrogenase [Paenibacillus validus]|uniref:2-hydroxyacid dehydrogenase n=1 Tax=Paenibacillus validus TaxID=44253 RepID=UPI000FDA2914|nr:NAD(P)-dependent oxidoreductase [Paenibacillus validus]MED4605072.1 NAD(P)-dependent oxidoreductase [Paenibacillus validus]